MIARQRTAECLSDLRLDQLLSGELSRAGAQAARAHLAACPLCEQRRAALVADRESFAARAPSFDALLNGPANAPAPVPAVRELPAARRRLMRVALPAAAVLALGIGLRSSLRERQRAEPSAAVADQSTRTKGSGAALGFVVRRAGRDFVGAAGQVLHPGDVLRFSLSSAVPVYAGVWGVDARGRVSSYQTGERLAAVAAGQRQLLPEAVELDESLGEERLVAVFCAAQLPVAEISSALEASVTAPALPRACGSEALGIVKAPP